MEFIWLISLLKVTGSTPRFFSQISFAAGALPSSPHSSRQVTMKTWPLSCVDLSLSLLSVVFSEITWQITECWRYPGSTQETRALMSVRPRMISVKMKKIITFLLGVQSINSFCCNFFVTYSIRVQRLDVTTAGEGI